MTKTKKKKPRTKSEIVVNPLYVRLFGGAQKKGDLRKAKILESAIHCIAELGIENTNFETIGRRAGMIRAHVQYYFHDRDDIVKAAIQLTTATAQEITIQAVTRATTDRARIDAVVEAAFEWAREYPEQIPIVGLLYYYATFKPDYQALHTQIRNVGAQRLAAVLGSVGVKGDLLTKAVAIHRLITGGLIDAFTTNPPPTRAEIEKAILVQIPSLLA